MFAYQRPLLILALLFLAVLISGYWLAHGGKPYATFIFTIHKLIALGAVVFLGWSCAGLLRGSVISPAQWLALAAVGLCLLATLATGGLLSALKDSPAFVLWMHRLLPYLSLLAVAWSYYSLFFPHPLTAS